MAIELYEHNIIPFNQIQTAVDNGENQIFVTATGTGKSYVAGKLIENSNNKRVMIITPRRHISEQWRKLVMNDLHRVDIVTYQRLSRIKSSDYKKTFSPYDLIIADEVHHAGAQSWGKPIEYCLKNAKKLGFSVIGLTADPVRYSDGGYDVSKELFNDERTDGLLLEEAIEQKVLPEFNYVSALYDFPEDIKDIYTKKRRTAKRSTTLDRLLGRLDIGKDNLKRITNIVIENIDKSNTKMDKRHIIVFVASTDDFANAKKFIRKIGIKNTFETSYKLSKKKNDAAISAFESTDNAALICVDMLNEGVHCKAVDTVVMLRRTTSPSIFFQQLGRALDSNSDKDIWVFDFVANAKALSVNNTFADERLVPVSSIVRKCCAQKITKDYATECLRLIHEIRCLLADKAKWEESEDDILRQFYPTEGHSCFARLPERSEAACRNRCAFLGLTYDVWSDEEIETLKTYYYEEGYAVSKRLNNKNASQISNKAQKLGLKRKSKTVEWSESDEALMQKFYADEGSAIAEKLSISYTTEQIKIKAKSMGLSFNRNEWTEAELDIVRKFYPDKNEITKRLPNRTWGAVGRQAKILGVAKKAPDAWTDEEIEFLRNNTETMTAEQIANALNRPCSSIKAKRKRLGLKGVPKNIWTDKDVTVLKKLYPTAPREEILKALPGRDWGTIIAHASRLKIRRKRSK